MENSIFLKMFSTGILCVSASSFSHAQFVNPDFETGDFTGWDTLGSAEVVTAAFGTPLLPGSTYAGRATTMSSPFFEADIEGFLGLSSGAIASIAGNPYNGSAIRQTAFLDTGTYSFAWKFLTDETIPQVTWKDTAFFVFNGNITFLADTLSPGFASSDTIYGSETPEPGSWGTLSFFVTEAGTYTFGVGVVNVVDQFQQSSIMLDSFQFTPIPEPGTVASGALFILLLGFALRRRLRSDNNKTAAE